MNKRKIDQLYNSTNYDFAEFKRLELDISSSYIMTIFGNYMFDLLLHIKNYARNKPPTNNFENDIFKNYCNFKKTKCIVLQYITKNKKIINKLFCAKFGYNIKTDLPNYFKKLSNSIVGMQYKKNSSDAHWIYIDSDGYVHNSYNNGLQLYRSNQFCQCYALLMAINPFYRNDFSYLKDSYKFGYNALLKLWNYLFDVVFHFSFFTEIQPKITVHDETINIVRNVNKLESPQIIKIILNDIIGNEKNFTSANIKTILNSKYALNNAPYFQ